MARIVIAGVLLASFFAAASLLASGEPETVEALYVFGDSYVDTGNIDPSVMCFQWIWPAGSTWPGFGTGRFSDGRVLTDYIGYYLQVDPPIPFRSLSMTTNGREIKNHKEHPKARVDVDCTLQGINFAYGGSGVITTANDTVSNITTQIQNLRTAINYGCVPIEKRSNSVVLFANNGNDYLAFLPYLINSSDSLLTKLRNLQRYIDQVVEQMVVDIKSLLSLGFTKFFITNIGPVELYPIMNIFSESPLYQLLLLLVRSTIEGHNSRLEHQTFHLISSFKNSTFFIVDLNKAFTITLQEKLLLPGPCLTDFNFQCGENAIFCPEATNVTVCSNVNETLFWDPIHPTQIGWSTLVSIILPNISSSDNIQQAFAKI